MKIIVGLGNPGKKYEKTRHNIGFRVVDEIAANFQLVSFQAAKAKMKKKKPSLIPIFNFQSIFNAQISKGKIAGEKVILVKPQTFMNLSGKTVKTLVNFHKITRPDLMVIHDDLDLPFGKIRISKGRGAAGHKGVESIIRELGTLRKSLWDLTGQAKNFVRFRIGIQPQKGKPKNVPEFVLKKFSKDEEKIIKEVIKKTLAAIEMAIKEGVEKAMNKYNQ